MFKVATSCTTYSFVDKNFLNCQLDDTRINNFSLYTIIFVHFVRVKDPVKLLPMSNMLN